MGFFRSPIFPSSHFPIVLFFLTMGQWDYETLGRRGRHKTSREAHLAFPFSLFPFHIKKGSPSGEPLAIMRRDYLTSMP